MKEYIVPTAASLDWTKAEKQSIDQCAWSPNPAPAASVQALFVQGDALYFLDGLADDVGTESSRLLKPFLHGTVTV